MNVVEYKGFQGSVDWEDNRLVIQVLHVDDFLTTECTDAKLVQVAFQDLVDDYLETCAELGKKPNKPFKGSFNVRVDPSVHRRAAMSAASNGQSLNAWIAEAIQEKLESGDKEKRLPDFLSQVQKIMAMTDAAAPVYRTQGPSMRNIVHFTKRSVPPVVYPNDEYSVRVWRGH